MNVIDITLRIEVEGERDAVEAIEKVKQHINVLSSSYAFAFPRYRVSGVDEELRPFVEVIEAEDLNAAIQQSSEQGKIVVEAVETQSTT